MKKLLIIIISLFTCLGVKSQIYNNFKEAGKYARADMDNNLASYFYEEALKLIPADSIIDIYVVNNHLRNIYKDLRNYEKAVYHGEKCLDIMHIFGENGQPYLIEDYARLANIYACMKEKSIAECYLDSALQIVSRPGTNMALQKKFATLAGLVYSHLGNWRLAESAYDLSVMFSQKYQVSDDTQLTLNLYGNSLYQNGKYKEALETYEKQRNICNQLFGKDSREYQWANYCIANILAYMGKIDEGREIYKEVLGWYRNKILHDLQSIPSSEREKYLDNMIELLQNAIPFGIEAQYNEDEFTALAYDALLLSKGLLLATEKSTQTIIQENGTPDERSELANIKKLKTELKNLLANSNSDQKKILNTYANLKTLDVQLANACARYGNNTTFASIGYEQVKNSLREDEVLLDFADFKPKNKSRQYVCYEIRRTQQHPTVHHICNGSELDSLLMLENNRWSNLYNGEAGDEMSSMIGNPLKKAIGNARTVYYVPSGIFHKLAIEAIQDGDIRLGDKYSFQRLSSARELATENQYNISEQALLYGGLTYSSEISQLPKSLQEVSEIANSLTDVLYVNTLTDNLGTKESFLDLSDRSPDIIHFSTHGFYYNPSDMNLPASLQGYNDAMSLSGLVMSGGSLSSNLGLLSAEDVARCNLSHTSIACLASCHSGQGEITSEGIYGLQRAFKKAGAGTVIMNLWEASDVATKCFMTNFYTDLIHGSKDRHKAFQYARDEVRKKYSAPYYWAGFVMID